MNQKIIAIILAAGQGKRMNSSTKKQFLNVNNIPVIVHTLKIFEACKGIDEIILVSHKEDLSYCKNQIVKAYGFTKVNNIIEGGRERYDSVFKALNALEDEQNTYVLIHDGARPIVSEHLLNKCIDQVIKYKACIVGVPVKDTIKKIDAEGFVVRTEDRTTLYAIQTPQAFELLLIKEAYQHFIKSKNKNATDDAMIVENHMAFPIKIIEGEYSNIKVTTPEDLLFMEIMKDNKRT